MTAHQFTELAPPARRREGGELDIVSVDQGLGHAFPPSACAQPLFLLKALRTMNARPIMAGIAAMPANGYRASICSKLMP